MTAHCEIGAQCGLAWCDIAGRSPPQSVLVMDLPRTLPIKVPPLPGEALDSWLEATAHHYASPWSELINALSMPARATPSANLMIGLTDAEVAAIAQACGVPADTVRVMTLAHFGGRAIGINTTTGQYDRTFPWGRARGSRFCPQCLAETQGRWQLTWRLGWTFVCPRHRCLLVDRCPECRQVPRLNSFTMQRIPNPGHCAHVLIVEHKQFKGRSCDAPLASANVLPLRANHPAVAAQQTIDDIIERNTAKLSLYAAVPQSCATVLSDVRAIARRVLRHWDAAELDDLVPTDLLAGFRTLRNNPEPNYRGNVVIPDGVRAPQDAVAAAVSVTAALAILNAGDEHAVAERLGWLLTDPDAPKLPKCVASLLREKAVSPALQTAEIISLAHSFRPTRQLRYRIGTIQPKPPVSDRRRCELLTTRLPTLLWPDWTARLAIPGYRLQSQRLTVPAALVAVGTTMRLAETLQRLDSRFTDAAATAVLYRMFTTNYWDDIRIALIRLADAIATTSTPINYGRRRQLRYRALLSERDWDVVRHDVDTTLSSRSTFTVRLYLCQRISAMPASHRYEVTVDKTSHVMRKMHQLLTPELSAALDSYALRFLQAHGITDEPVVWSPDTSILDDLLLPGDATPHPLRALC